jgi:hypothetical protein
MKTNKQAAEILGDGERLSEAPAARSPPLLSLVEPPLPGTKAWQLFNDARVISLDHLAQVASTISLLRDLLDTVVDAGDLYVPGAHEQAERLSEDLFWKSKSLELVTQRQRDSGRTTPRRR